MKNTLLLAAGALAASVPLLAQNAAPLSQPLDDFKVLDREVGVSGDFLYGNGYVQLPLGEALFRSSSIGNLGGLGVGKFTTADRKSAIYYGGTLSESIGKTWFLDMSYYQGTTEGALNDLRVFGFDRLNSHYKLSDQYYQLFGKYAFPQFSGTRFAAYLKLGVTYTDNTANVDYNTYPAPASGVYESKSNDYLGNIGVGGEYYLYRGDSFKVTVMTEGEVFGGLRKSEIHESLSIPGILYATGSFNQDSIVYGGVGRVVLRLVKSLGREGRWKLNADLGFQGKYLINEFDSLASEITDGIGKSRSNVHGTELLWGPYGRVGLS